jgi:hypothetical protein
VTGSGRPGPKAGAVPELIELAGWDEGPGVSEADLRWLTVEYAVAAVAKSVT